MKLTRLKANHQPQPNLIHQRKTTPRNKKMENTTKKKETLL